MHFGLVLFFIIFSLFFLVEESYGAPLEEDSKPKPQFVPTLVDPSFKIELVQLGLNMPTKITFIDEKTILVAQKPDGKIMVIKNFVKQEHPALDLNVDSGWERGLTGLTSVNYQGKNYVFVYYTESTINDDTYVQSEKDPSPNNGNKLVRYTWNGTSLVDPLLILHPISLSGPMHQGGAMTVLDDQLYLIVGDNSQRSYLNNESDPSGAVAVSEALEGGGIDFSKPSKFTNYDISVIFRINFDGSPVASNPFSEPNFTKYYAYGIRNGYGLTVDPLTNNIWDTENGANDFDEINLVFPGFNSGWKKIMGPQGKGKFTSELSELVSIEGSRYADPKFSWKSAIAPTAIEFLNSEKYGTNYQNDVFVGNVHGDLYRFDLNEKRDGFVFSNSLQNDLVVDNTEELESIIFGKNFGIITDIKVGPDGYLYVVSMVQLENLPGWTKYAQFVRQEQFKEESGLMMGAIFRIIPTPTIEELGFVPAPRLQMTMGIPLKDITCKEGLELIFKISNNSPACVKPFTKLKLVNRGGWTF